MLKKENRTWIIKHPDLTTSLQKVCKQEEHIEGHHKNRNGQTQSMENFIVAKFLQHISGMGKSLKYRFKEYINQMQCVNLV